MRIFLATVLAAVLLAVHPSAHVDDQQRMRLRQRTSAGGGACAFPSCFPDATNTGYAPTGVTLTAYSGPFTFTSGTTTIDSKLITTCITITGGTLNITRSSIVVGGPSGCGDGGALDSEAPGILNITDTTINCGGDPPGGYNNSHGMERDNITALRVNIFGCENGTAFDGSHDTITDSYIHDLRQCTTAEGCQSPDGSHTDGIQTGAGGPAHFYDIRHNTILSMKLGAHTPEPSDVYYTTSAIITDPNDDNGTIRENLVAGGAYDVYCPETGSVWSLTNNRFSTRYKASVGFFGPSDACASHSGVTISGNVYYETGLPITLTAPAPQPIALFMRLFFARPGLVGMGN